MNMTFRTLLLVAAGIALFAPTLRAGHDWPQWRGPHFDGSSDATDLPDIIDKDKVAWTTQLPGVGSGTPVVFGDRIFVSTVDPQSYKLLGTCVSRTDGHILWSKEIGTGFTKNERNNAASPSAVTDGKIVYFYFSTGDLAAFDVEGKPLWQRSIQKDHGTFNILWVYSSSPLLYKGKLYVQVIHRNVAAHGLDGGPGGVDSYLLALNPQTGQDIWSVIRPSDAVGESRESYATPTPFEHDGRSEIILVGGDCVTAHDAETGKELWRAGGWNPKKENHWRLVPSASFDAQDGLVFAFAHPRAAPSWPSVPAARGMSRLPFSPGKATASPPASAVMFASPSTTRATSISSTAIKNNCNWPEEMGRRPWRQGRLPSLAHRRGWKNLLHERSRRCDGRFRRPVQNYLSDFARWKTMPGIGCGCRWNVGDSNAGQIIRVQEVEGGQRRGR